MKFFCWLRRIGADREVLRCYEWQNRTRCSGQDSRGAGRALLQAEYSDDVRSYQGSTISTSREQSQPLCGEVIQEVEAATSEVGSVQPEASYFAFLAIDRADKKHVWLAIEGLRAARKRGAGAYYGSGELGCCSCANDFLRVRSRWLVALAEGTGDICKASYLLSMKTRAPRDWSIPVALIAD
jgi:hypothetical protein